MRRRRGKSPIRLWWGNDVWNSSYSYNRSGVDVANGPYEDWTTSLALGNQSSDLNPKPAIAEIAVKVPSEMFAFADARVVMDIGGGWFGDDWMRCCDKRIHIRYDTTEYRTLEAFLYDQTLGGLIHVLKQGGGLTDTKLKKGLYGALRARNLVAYTALENHDPMQYRMAERRVLLAWLQELRFKVGVPFLIVREFRKVCEEEIGITEEQLQSRLMSGQHEENDS